MGSRRQIEMIEIVTPAPAATLGESAGGDHDRSSTCSTSSGFCNIMVIALHCVLSVILGELIPCWTCIPALSDKLEAIVTHDYFRTVARVRLLALTNCCIVSLNRFLGFCIFTWASAIILGGFIGELASFYFRLTSALLILQALQFGTAAAWRTFLPPRRLALTQAPQVGSCVVIRDTNRGAYLIRIEQYCIILLISLTSGRALKVHNLCGQTGEKELLFQSLYVFSWLVFLNGCVAAAGIFCGRRLFYYDISPCLGDYYDTIIRVSMESGLIGARKVELIDTLFEMIGEEYRQRGVVVEGLFEMIGQVYEHMIDYVYRHERGFEATLTAMESEDRYVQEAAVYMVGFWADREADDHMKLLRFEGVLIRRLIEIAQFSSTGRTARAAVASLHKLAKNDPDGIMMAQKDIVPVLCRQIVDAVDLREHLCFSTKPGVCESLPIVIKALVALLQSLQGAPDTAGAAAAIGRRQYKCLTDEERGHLEDSLLAVFQCPRSSKRLQAVAGYALHKTLQSTAFSDSILLGCLMASDAAPRVSEDILQDELDIYFNYLSDLVPAQWDTHSLLKSFTTNTKVQAPGNESCEMNYQCIFSNMLVLSIALIVDIGYLVAVYYSYGYITANGPGCRG